MQCPPEIAAVHLRYSPNRPVADSRVGDAQRSVVESDHLHNLPDLLTNYSLSFSIYYLCVERVSFIERKHAGRHQRLRAVVEGLSPITQRLRRARRLRVDCIAGTQKFIKVLRRGPVAHQHAVELAELDLQAVCQLDAAAGLDGLQASGLATSPIPGARPAEAHDLLFCEVGPPLRLYGS